MSILHRLAILLLWYFGASLILFIVLGWDNFTVEGGILITFLSVGGFLGVIAITAGLPFLIITLWIGPKIRSTVIRFVLVLITNVVIVATLLTLGFTPDYEEPNVLKDAIVVLGYVTLIPLTLFVAHLLAKVPEWDTRPPHSEYE